MTKKIALVFYDATCVLCDRAILWLIKNDVESLFYFSHVTSNTAQKQVFIVTTESKLKAFRHMAQDHGIL